MHCCSLPPSRARLMLLKITGVCFNFQPPPPAAASAAAAAGAAPAPAAARAPKTLVVRGAWWSVLVPGVIEIVQVAANEDLVGINVNSHVRPSYRPALAFLGWLELVVPGDQLFVEKAPPMLVVGMVQECNLLFEENLMIHMEMILERGEVDGRPAT